MSSFTVKAPGAVAEPQTGVIAHYGDFSGEQWALETASALCEFPDLGIVSVTGRDRLAWLTTLSSQVLTNLSSKESAEILFLDPQGRIQFSCDVYATDDAALLITEGAKVTTLVEFLTKMRFMFEVEISDLSASYRVFGTVIPLAQKSVKTDLLLSLPGATYLWADPWPNVVEGGATYTPLDFQHPGLLRLRVFVLVAVSELENFFVAWLSHGDADCPWAGRNAWEALRIEDLRPDYAHEVDEKTLPHELDWLRTSVHLSKGCYCGQEAVARIVNLGKPPRRLVLLQLDGSTSVQVKIGATVLAGSREVGKITSVARHADLGPIALAVVRRGLALETALTVVQGEDEVSALQEVIVDPSGKSSASPAERPGSELRGINLRTR